MTAQLVDVGWQVKAACRGPQAAIFFPPPQFERKDEKIERERRAKEICASCPVQQPCLQYALGIRDPLGLGGGPTAAVPMERLPR